jgi:hypothetical protein
MWNEATLDLFELLPRRLPGWWSKAKRNHNLDSRFVGRNLKRGPPEYKGPFYPHYRTI